MKIDIDGNVEYIDGYNVEIDIDVYCLFVLLLSTLFIPPC
jgi:hypothetical protein